MLKHLYLSIKPILHANLAKYAELQLTEGRVTYILRRSVTSGWYMLELLMEGGFQADTVTLSCMGGTSCLDARRFCLTIKSGRLAKRILYFPKHVSLITLSVDSGSDASIVSLRFVRLQKQFAVQRMLARVASGLGVSESKVLSQIQHSTHSERGAIEHFLFNAYDRSFLQLGHDEYLRWCNLVEPNLLFGESSSYLSFYKEGLKNNDGYKVFVASSYRLTEYACAMMVGALLQNPSAVLVYADEDVIDQWGQRSHPNFKSDWDIDLFSSFDYISAFYVCRLDWFQKNQNVFQEFGVHLALSALLPKEPKSSVLHLPLILGHRIKESMAVPCYDFSKRQLALEQGLSKGLRVAEGLIPFSLRILPPMPKPEPLVSLIIPTRDALAVLQPCIESILKKTTYLNYEILIIDNQSSNNETLDWFSEVQVNPKIRILKYDSCFNYSAINNFGVHHALGSVIGLINNDIEVISGNWLTEMVSHVMRPEVGCVGAKLYYSNDQIQHGGVILGLGHVAGHAHRFLARDADGYQGRLKLVQGYSAVTAACLLVRREVYEQVGGLDEQNLTVAYNDVDFCLRVRAEGYRNLWTPYAELYHHESVSRGEDDTPEKKARFDREVAYMRQVWGRELDHDPCYNPNLSLRREDFALREFL